MTARIEDGGPAAHTAGPWTVGAEDDFGGISFIEILANDEQTDIAHVQCSAPDTDWTEITDEDRANAALIAAAPCLLAALEEIVASLADQDDEGMVEHAPQMIAARAAISRARQMDLTVGRANNG